MNSRLAKITDRLRSNTARERSLFRVSSRPISRYEIAAYAVLPLLLIMAGAMPSAAIFVLPAIVPFLYLLFRRFGFLLPLACIGVYGGLSLALNYDILTVIYTVWMGIAFIGLVLSAQVKPFYVCAAIAVVSSCLGAVVGTYTVRLAEGKNFGEIAAEYVYAEYDDPFIGYLARSSYDGAELPKEVVKLERTDEGYDDAVVEYAAVLTHDEVNEYVIYYCVHFGGIIAAIAYFISVIISRRTASCKDAGVTEAELRLSTRSLGGVRVEQNPISEMRVPRAFLLICVLPAICASLILELLGDNGSASATVMHILVTIPASMSFIALCCFFASLFRGKARTAANIVVALIAAVAVIFPIALFIFSILGVCDVILNLRFWTRFIMSD